MDSQHYQPLAPSTPSVPHQGPPQAQQHASNEYSTLEVAPNHSYGNEGAAAPEAYQDAPKEAVNGYYGNPNDQQQQQWAHESGVPQVYDNKYHQHPNAVPYYGQYPPPAEGTPAAGAAAPERRILGMTRKVFLIVLAVVLVVVVGAVVGGAVGGTVGKHNGESTTPPASTTTAPASTPSASPTPTPGSNSTILDGSSISSANWTDDKGKEYRGVFWQDRNSKLMMSLWDSGSGGWNVVNITSVFTDSVSAVKPLKNTPLAAVVRSYPFTAAPWNWPFTLSLFYVNVNNVVQEVASTDIAGKTWKLGGLSTTPGDGYTAAAGSSLAAHWSLCASYCSGNVSLLYEDSSQSLRIANSSNWSANPPALVANLVQGSPLGATAMAPGGGAQTSAANAIRLYADISNVLQEVMQDMQGPWYYASALGHGLPTDPPQISAYGFSNATTVAVGPTSIVVATRYTNGSLAATFWNNKTWSGNTTPSFLGNTPTTLLNANFTAVSVSGGKNLKAYTITNFGELHSWTMDRIDPTQWTYDQKVAVGTVQ